MARNRRFLLVCLTFTLVSLARSADCRERRAPGTEQRVAALVELLASKNSPPKAKEGDLIVPKDYDRSAQVIVYLGIQQLMSEGADAFDTLAAHFDDKRYSFSYRGVSGDGNMTVGGACHWIMKQSIECYASEIHRMTRDQDFVYLYRQGKADQNLAKWWKTHKKRPLWELQLEAIDHMIKFMETVRREKAQPPYLDGGLADEDRFEALRKENLEILAAMKMSIETTKQPFRPKVLHLGTAWMGYLPWPTFNPGK